MEEQDVETRFRRPARSPLSSSPLAHSSADGVTEDADTDELVGGLEDLRRQLEERHRESCELEMRIRAAEVRAGLRSSGRRALHRCPDGRSG